MIATHDMGMSVDAQDSGRVLVGHGRRILAVLRRWFNPRPRLLQIHEVRVSIAP
jgi:hypothetical protein